MSDIRRTRRIAEQAARETLNGSLVAVAGELEADAAVANAVSEADTSSATYAGTSAKARDAGWTSTQLRAMGYDRPRAARTSRSADASAQANTKVTVLAPSAVQHEQSE